MFTPTTRPRGDANLPSRLGRTDETVSLLGRRITDLKKQKDGAAATGGVIGIAEVDTIKATVLHSATGLDRIGLRYGEPYDYGVPDIMRAGEFCTVNLNGIYLTPGSYTMTVRIDYGWAAGTSGVPSCVQAAIANTGSPSDAMVDAWAPVIPVITRSADAGARAGISGICAWTPPSPTIVTSADDLFWVELSCFQPAPVGTPVSGVNGDQGLHWTIWKWS